MIGTRSIRRRRFLLPLLAVVLAATGCATKQGPLLERLAGREERVPVVLVPGITGSGLRETTTDQVLWGRGTDLFRPRDGGYALALPLGDDGRREDSIEPAELVFEIRLLGLFRFPVYGPLWETLERNGYRPGDLADPGPDETLFAFSYDWRRGNGETVRALAEALERLRLARGEATLEIDVIGHSNAARLVRWYLKYGDASLEEAEAGRARPPAGVRVRKLILIGADNAGALDTLRRLNRGRSYAPFAGRRFLPETLFGFESLIETLPAYRDDLFFDENGAPMEVDLFDAGNWERFGWSVFAPETRARLQRPGAEGLFGDEPARIRYLERALDRARRTHRMLAEDRGGSLETRYHIIRNLQQPTGHRAMLAADEKGNWNTWFADDAPVRKDPYLHSLAATAGDGYAAMASQDRLASPERKALAGPPHDVPAGHRELVRHPAALRIVLEVLAMP